MSALGSSIESAAVLAAASCEAPVFVAARAGTRPFEKLFVPEPPSAQCAAAEPFSADFAAAAAWAADDPPPCPAALDLPDVLDLRLESSDCAADFKSLELGDFAVEDGFDAVEVCLLVAAEV